MALLFWRIMSHEETFILIIVALITAMILAGADLGSGEGEQPQAWYCPRCDSRLIRSESGRLVCPRGCNGKP